MLKLINKVAKNDVSEAINNIIDAIATSLNDHKEYQKEMYKITLEVLKTDNERLWFNLCLRLGKIYHDFEQFEELD